MVSKFQECYVEAFNLLCGDKIGEGAARTVFECRLLPDMVVKVESNYNRTFQNVMECKFWDDNQYAPEIAKWLAPCHFLSPDGRILIQSKITLLAKESLPKRIPEFLWDVKPSHFGLYKGNVVCCDYGLVGTKVSMKLIKGF